MCKDGSSDESEGEGGNLKSDWRTPAADRKRADDIRAGEKIKVFL